MKNFFGHRPLCLILVCLLVPAQALALPVGLVVREGEAVVEASDARSLLIRTSDRAILEFESFSIGADETVRFFQPSAQSSLLSRVTGSSSSLISGSLWTNGELILVNPMGIHFTATADVQARSLIASTLDIQNALYRSGNLVFESRPGFSGGIGILNEAVLEVAEGGHLAFLSESIVNKGTLRAGMGSVLLASGRKLTLSFDPLQRVHLVVDLGEEALGKDGTPLIDNSGLLAGRYVRVEAQTLERGLDTLINHSGVIEASGLTQGPDGTIELVSSSGMSLSGELGGDVELKGTTLRLDGDLRMGPAGFRYEGEWELDEGDSFTLVLPEADLSAYSANFRKGFGRMEYLLSSTRLLAPEHYSAPTAQNLPDGKLRVTHALREGITLSSVYEASKARTLGADTTPTKQTVIIDNPTSEGISLDFSIRTLLDTSQVRWADQSYTASADPVVFRAFEQTSSVTEYARRLGLEDVEGLDRFGSMSHTYTAGTFLTYSDGEGNVGRYDWSDVVREGYEHEVLFEQSGAGSALTLRLPDLDVAAGATLAVDPDYALSTNTTYNARFDGSAAADYLGDYGAIATGDLNGDGLGDLAIGGYGADNNGNITGSIWVIFSTLLDDYGVTTGNDLPLSTAANYNVRYDGAVVGDQVPDRGSLAIGDVNGDHLGDLVIGTSTTDPTEYGFLFDTGSVWVIFSTLLDDVGTTTGNNKALSVAGNYNIRYDGAQDDRLTDQGTMAIGDANGDGFDDLVLGTRYAANNGADSGSAWVIFSTLIDDVGATTGNIKPLTIGANYNIRYDGGAAGDYLTGTGALRLADVNGDSLNDLVMGAYAADYNGANSGSTWVVFSTLLDDVGASTGNNKALSTGTNFNIRYDGGAAGDGMTELESMAVGDVNGDGFGDLVLGAPGADNNGALSGSAWVMFSTLIDDVGATTGNVQALSTASNYNIRYDGGGVSDQLTLRSALKIGDLNGDGKGDLVLAGPTADNNGINSGSAWVMFSTLIDDVGTTTGNNKALSTAGNYNIRYDGDSAGQFLALGGTLHIGDLDADGLGDLVLAASLADNNGADSGSAWIMLSTLIDDVGSSTGNVMSLSSAANYSMRYDGAAADDYLTTSGAIASGDINGDSRPDLILATGYANNNGVDSGSAWIVFNPLPAGTLPPVGGTSSTTTTTTQPLDAIRDALSLSHGVDLLAGLPSDRLERVPFVKSRTLWFRSEGDLEAFHLDTLLPKKTFQFDTPISGVYSSAGGDRVYVLLPEERRLCVIDASSGDETYIGGLGASPTAFALNSTGTEAYVADSQEDIIQRVDLRLGKVIQRIRVGSYPNALKLSKDDSYLFVVCALDGTLCKVDLAGKGGIIATTKLPGSTSGLALSADGSELYMGAVGDNHVLAYASDSLQSRDPITTGREPRYIAVDDLTHTLVAANTVDRTLSLVDLDTRRQLKSLPLSEEPTGLALYPEGGSAVVTGSKGQLSVFAIRDHSALRSRPSGLESSRPAVS